MKLPEELIKLHQQEQSLSLERRTTKYGQELAGEVATVLVHKGLFYGHRDYCGMGLEYRNKTYHYGEVWDGYMDDNTKQWSSREDFVNWLAEQSDASLGRLDDENPFFHGNQSIHWERLLEFVARQ